MQPPERSVKLTFPAREPGARRIMADGIQVGVCLQGHTRKWRAYLWTRALIAGSGYEIKADTVGQLRVEVRGWLESKGPWWSETAATREAG